MIGMLDFRGKHVLVTDSVEGLGRRIAERFHDLGATVAINGPTKEAAELAISQMGGGSRLAAAPGELTQISGIRAMVEHAATAMPQLDALVCSTARGDLRRIDEVTAEYWEAVLADNLKAAFFACQASLPALKRSKGCIVNVASIIGLVSGPAGAAVYSTAKGALVHMSRMMALELAGDGIRVNAFCPGWVAPRPADSQSTAPEELELQAYIARRSPFQRTATLDECANAVLYLASPLSSYTSGAALVADGALTSGHYHS